MFLLVILQNVGYTTYTKYRNLITGAVTLHLLLKVNLMKIVH